MYQNKNVKKFILTFFKQITIELKLNVLLAILG